MRLPDAGGDEPGSLESERAVLWCDGRRRYDLSPGARVEVRRGELPVLLARVHGLGGQPAAASSPTAWWRSSACPSPAGAAGRPVRPLGSAFRAHGYLPGDDPPYPR